MCAQEGGPRDRADELRSLLILEVPDDDEARAWARYEADHAQELEDVTTR